MRKRRSEFLVILIGKSKSSTKIHAANSARAKTKKRKKQRTNRRKRSSHRRHVARAPRSRRSRRGDRVLLLRRREKKSQINFFFSLFNEGAAFWRKKYRAQTTRYGNETRELSAFCGAPSPRKEEEEEEEEECRRLRARKRR